MIEKYIKYVNAFEQLYEEDKKKEIVNQLKDLLEILYNINYDVNDKNELLPIIDSFEDERFLSQVFTCILSIKEENAKILDYLLDSKN